MSKKIIINRKIKLIKAAEFPVQNLDQDQFLRGKTIQLFEKERTILKVLKHVHKTKLNI